MIDIQNFPYQIERHSGNQKERDIAVDYFKMLATLFVMNSHAEILYPKFSFLASGGAIGDALFMFCSGFTLFMGSAGRFDNYYKRRLSRIVPSMVAVSLFLSVVGWVIGSLTIAGTTIGLVVSSKNYLTWILIFYIPLFFVKKYLSDKMVVVWICTGFMVCIAYFFFPYKYETGIKGMWGSAFHNYKWFWYFVIMLWGAYIGKIHKKLEPQMSIDVAMTILCFIGFYAFPTLSKKYVAVAPYQILMLPLLMGFCLYLYKLLSNKFFAKIYKHSIANWLIMVIGGLCLESYLVHMKLFTPTLNSIFPLNLFVIYSSVLFVAYIIRCIARIILQTFQKDNYNWEGVFSLK